MHHAFSELRGRHAGQDVWIIGGAASAGLIDPEFFASKITVGMNRAFRRFPTTYLVCKDADVLTSELAMAGCTVICAEHDWARHWRPKNEFPGAYVFPHFDWDEGKLPDVEAIGTDRILVSRSILGSAMHVACELGAANVILCGVDGGTLDGAWNWPGYYADAEVIDPDTYRHFVSELLRETRDIRDALQRHYGCRIYSLSPFVGLTTDRRQFQPAEAS